MPATANPRTAPAIRAMHASLVIVWLGTALVSALDYLGLSGLDHEGARLLASGGVANPAWQAMLIWAGLIVGGIFFFLAPLINKLMHGVK